MYLVTEKWAVSKAGTPFSGRWGLPRTSVRLDGSRCFMWRIGREDETIGDTTLVLFESGLRKLMVTRLAVYGTTIMHGRLEVGICLFCFRCNQFETSGEFVNIPYEVNSSSAGDLHFSSIICLSVQLGILCCGVSESVLRQVRSLDCFFVGPSDAVFIDPYRAICGHLLDALTDP